MPDKKSEYLVNLALENHRDFPALDLDLASERYHNKRIFTLEGINASGKTTQVNLLKSSYLAKHIFFLPKHPPSLADDLAFGSIKGNGKKFNAIGETLLFLATETYKEHLASKVPALNLFYDRYIDTLYLCQFHDLLNEGYNETEIFGWLENVSSFLPLPEHTFVLNVSFQNALNRIKKRKELEGRDIQDIQIDQINNLRNASRP